MKYLSMQERVNFVNTVVDNATQDGVYIPALLDIYFRIQFMVDVFDFDISKYKPEQYPEIAYGKLYTSVVSKDGATQLSSLFDACKEEAAMRREYAIGLVNYNKKSSADELIDVIIDYFKKMEENIGDVDINKLSNMVNLISKLDVNSVAGKIAAGKEKAISFEKVKKEAVKNGRKKQPH